MLRINKSKAGRAHRAGRILAMMLLGISVNQLASAGPVATGTTPQGETRFTNIGSIANTRHNMSQSTMTDNMNQWMDGVRNDYGQVCVYCHTPHAANSTAAAPLWNRTIKAQTYATYDQLGTSTLTQTIGTPGPASLTCLSCHDGQTAIDSIINMPGSGMADNAQATTQSPAFLDTWANVAGITSAGSASMSHLGLNSDDSVASNFKEGNGTGVTTNVLTQGSTNSVLTNTGPPATPPGGSVVEVGCNPGIFGPPLNILAPGYCLYTVTTPAFNTTDPAAGCLTCHAEGGVPTLGGVIVDFRMFNLGTDL
ncbi:MAG: hypothetical protein R8M11_03050, partial [Gallionella sp.]